MYLSIALPSYRPENKTPHFKQLNIISVFVPYVFVVGLMEDRLKIFKKEIKNNNNKNNKQTQDYFGWIVVDIITLNFICLFKIMDVFVTIH